MAKGEFALRDPEVPWSEEEWTQASRYSFKLWWSEEDQLHLAQCVELPVAISHGDTPEEAIHNAIDSVAVTLQAEVESPPPAGEFAGDDRYTSGEVAAMLGVTVRRVQALAKSRGVGAKRGRDLVFTQDDVQAMRDRRPGRPKG